MPDPSTSPGPIARSLPCIYIALAIFIIVLLWRRHAPQASFLPPPTPRSHIDQDSLAPDFTLQDAHGDPAKNPPPPTLTLSELTKKQPVLLIFYLGYSCPRCMSSLHELEDYKADIDAAGVQIVAIGPNSVDELRDAIDRYGDFPFPMLADPDDKIAAAYDLQDGDRNLHGCFLIDKNRTIRFAMASSHPYDNFSALVNLCRGIKE